MSLRFGALASLDPAVQDVRAEVFNYGEGLGADAVLLAAPNPKLVPAALKILRPGGRLLLFVSPCRLTMWKPSWRTCGGSSGAPPRGPGLPACFWLFSSPAESPGLSAS